MHAVFVYEDGSKRQVTGYGSVRGIGKRINDEFSRPIRVEFKDVPDKMSDIDSIRFKHWKRECTMALSRTEPVAPVPATDLTFTQLRAANIARIPLFRNKLGELAHNTTDGSDWSPAQWLQALLGELGEYANIRKKFERGDYTEREFKEAAANELADVQCYLDILAYQLGVDLGGATAAKWNAVSERIGCKLRVGVVEEQPKSRVEKATEQPLAHEDYPNDENDILRSRPGKRNRIEVAFNEPDFDKASKDAFKIAVQNVRGRPSGHIYLIRDVMCEFVSYTIVGGEHVYHFDWWVGQ